MWALRWLPGALLWRNAALRKALGTTASTVPWAAFIAEQPNARMIEDNHSRAMKLGTAGQHRLSFVPGGMTERFKLAQCDRCPRRCGLVVSHFAHDEDSARAATPQPEAINPLSAI
jgi:hypothetical protein